jgi:kinesin family protein 1
MIATISPADINYDETLSTLRYADRAKQIMCKAVINEDPNAKLIRDLKAEVARLRDLIKAEGLEGKIGSSEIGGLLAAQGGQKLTREAALEKLKESERFMEELKMSWEEKLLRTQDIMKEREQLLVEMGVAVNDDRGAVGVYSPKKTPHLVNLNEDPSMSECLIYYIKSGITNVGKAGAIQLYGDYIQDEHCVLENSGETVTIAAVDSSQTFVNGHKIDSIELKTGDRIILGDNHVFKFRHPLQAYKPPENSKLVPKFGGMSVDRSADPSPYPSRSGSPTTSRRESSFSGVALDLANAEWSQALRELMKGEGYDIREGMESRIVALEEQLKEELVKKDEQLERQRLEYELRLAEMEDRYARQSEVGSLAGDEEPVYYDDLREEDIPLAQKVVEKWKSYSYISVRDTLLYNAALLKEANALSIELKKHVLFQFTLLSNSPYSPLPANISQGKDVDNPLEEDELGFLNIPSAQHSSPVHCGCVPRPLVVVEVKDSKHGATYLWSLQKLRQRLLAMRELNGLEWNRSNSPPGEARPESPRMRLTAKDPFYDRYPWIRLIGRSFVYMSNLLVFSHLVSKVTIVNEKGEVKGHLTVSIRPIPEDEKDEEVLTKSARIEFGKNAAPAEVPPGSTRLLEVIAGSPEVPGEKVGDSNKKENSDDTRSLEMALEATLTEGYENDHELETTLTVENGTNDDEVVPSMSSIPEIITTPPLTTESSEKVEEGDHSDSNDDTLRRRQRSRGSSFIELDSIGSEGKRVPVLQGKFFERLEISPELENQELLHFRVTILQAVGIPRDFTDIFVQFRFLNSSECTFSTHPLKNDGSEFALGYYHMQNISVPVNSAFLYYLRHYPLILEVFGHYQQHPLHSASTEDILSISDNHQFRRSASPSNQSSQVAVPVRSPKTTVFDAAGSTHTVATVDLLVHFEILELSPNGEYLPAVVDHSNVQTNGGCFLLQQGIQRRIALTITYETGCDIKWNKVVELVVGRVRSSQKSSLETDNQSNVLSLNLFKPVYYVSNDKDRTSFRFEGAWDSSLHNSILLNRLTPQGETVFLTISAYIELENCSQPSCISKDMCVTIHSRDSRPSISRSFFSFITGKKMESNASVGLYELCLRKSMDKTEPTRSTLTVPDPAASYVRGEENLRGWRPRRESLIWDHQAQLYTLETLEEMEKARHLLQVREKLDLLDAMKNTVEPPNGPGEVSTSEEPVTEERKWELAKMVITQLTGESFDLGPDISVLGSDPSPEAVMTPTSCDEGSISSVPSQLRRLSTVPTAQMCIPEIREIVQWRSNPIARKGYLNFLQPQDSGWERKYVVVRRPFVIIYASDKDLVEHDVINLTTAKVQFNEDTKKIIDTVNTFTICTKHRGFLLQSRDRDTYEWLYALDPLLAGTMKSQLNSSQKRRQSVRRN